MIMQRKSDGSYEQIGFIKSKDGDNIDKIVDKNGDIYFEQGFTREISGVPPLMLDTIGKPLKNYIISGNTVQDGTPSPDNPVEVKSVSDLVTEGEFSGKYMIPVVMSGKNLCPDLNDLWEISNYNNILDIEVEKNQVVLKNIKGGIDTGFLFVSPKIKLKKGQYVLTFDVYTTQKDFSIQSGNSNFRLQTGMTDTDGKYYGSSNMAVPPNTWTRCIFRITVPNDNEYKVGIGTDVPNINKSETLIIKNPQLELGSEATPYEPYHEPITTPIYLNEPLRKIGDYADSIDFKKETVERKIKKLVLTGNEPFYSNHLDISLFSLNMNDYLRKLMLMSSSSHYQAQGNVETYSRVSDFRITFYANQVSSGDLLYIRDSRFSTINDFKTYLKQEYAKGTPVTIFYILDVPETESIILPEISAFNGTTKITTDTEIQPSNIEITYKARK